jgi:branched-chain amino acid transport system ATP-binding protein
MAQNPSPARQATKARGQALLLRVERVSVHFGGLAALGDVELGVEEGRITGLIGPNGAGKTTLFNVITGLQEPTEGRVLLNEEEITNLRPHRRARLGIGRTFQRLEVFGSLTARENILVSAEIRRGWARGEAADPRGESEELLDRVGLRQVADERVDALPTGLARLVELGRALATRPQILLLDEPSSGLNEGETEVLGDLLIDLARQGLGVLLVEHDVGLVMRVCEIIHVLDFGRILAVGTPPEIQANVDVQTAYLGTSAGDAA